MLNQKKIYDHTVWNSMVIDFIHDLLKVISTKINKIKKYSLTNLECEN
jgi:hypothetical protein